MNRSSSFEMIGSYILSLPNAEENRYAKEKRLTPLKQFAPKLREPVSQGKVILLDQLGLMENDAPDFQQAALEYLREKET